MHAFNMKLCRNLQSSVVSFRPDSPIYYDVSGVLDWSQL